MPRFLRAGLLASLLIPCAVLAEGGEASAKALRAEASGLRQTAQQEFDASKAECQKAFRVNYCIDQAVELRVAKVNRARALEAEATKLELAAKRRAVEARDAEQAEADHGETACSGVILIRLSSADSLSR